MGLLTKEIPEIDLRSIGEVLRLRWWIVPLCMVIGLGILTAQESNMQLSPSSVVVAKTFGPRDETSGLAVYGIDPTSIKEFPTFQNQLLDVRKKASVEIESQLGGGIDVSVTRPEPQVSLIASSDNSGKQQLTMLSVGQPNYDIGCIASEAELCEKAIDIFVSQISVARAAGITNGLQQLADQIQKVLDNSGAALPQLELQHDALNTAINSVTGEVKLVSEMTEARSATVSTVKKSTYLFGLIAGMIIGILIVLQLTYTDNKIRTVRKIKSLFVEIDFLGEITQKNTIVDTRHTAAALVHKSRSNNVDRVALVPLDTDTAVAQLVGMIASDAEKARITITVGTQVDLMSITDLVADEPQSIVLVATKHRSTNENLHHAFDVLTRAGHSVLGVILASSSV